jgi:hypothetical protein
MLRGEGTEAARDQILGFLYLADLLDQQYRGWKIRRDQVFQAWDSPAGQQFLLKLDQYGNDLLVDAACARQTAHALDRTVEALTKAQKEVAPLVDRWDQVTARDDPGQWNAVAEDLNKQAWRVMVEADKAVAAARPYFAAPDLLNHGIDPKDYSVIVDDVPGTQPPGSSTTKTESPAFGSVTKVPPVPGYEPLVGTRATPELSAATGAPQFLAAVPGQPVSMLPIPPGNVFAPFGGAYILPGPGVGKGGYVVPIPQHPMTAPRVMPSPGLSPQTAGGGVAAGMMPMPMSGGQGGGGSHAALYRRPSVKWQGATGVPPVIKVDQDEFVLNQPSPTQDAEFREWFTDMAYPWRAEFKNSEGAHVTIRTVPQ